MTAGLVAPGFVTRCRRQLLSWRNRLLMEPRLRRMASAFPLTRPAARRHTRELFDLCAGFVYSQVLSACIRLDLFQLLEETGPLTAAVLADRLGLPEARLAVLLRAAVSLRLLEDAGAREYAVGPLGAVLLGNPGLKGMIEHHHMLYADLADPVGLLRGDHGQTGLAGYWGYAGAADPANLEGTEVAPYSELMAASQALVADEILAAYPFARHQGLLDIGGGLGAFVAAVAARAPSLELALLDLPAVAAGARCRLHDQGLGQRVQVHAGDFLSDPLLRGADLVSLVRVIHDHDDEAALALLAAVHAALPRDGTLLLAEPLAGTRRAEAAGAAYFGFYLLAMGSGRPRTRPELEQLLRAAGFHDVKERPTGIPLLVRVLVAKK